MPVVILVAHDDNRVIGHKHKMPWHIPEDLKLFKKRTLGYKVLMGRKTWDSLPVQPLPGRLNYVLTRTKYEGEPTDHEDGPIFVSDIVKVCTDAKKNNDNLFIIGGAQIYELALKLGVVDKVIVSRIRGSYPGDVYFPSLPEDRWSHSVVEKYEGFDVIEFTRSR